MNARFFSVTEFLYLYGVGFVRSKNLIQQLKKVLWSFLTIKNAKNKVELQRYCFLFLDFSYILAIRPRDL